MSLQKMEMLGFSADCISGMVIGGFKSVCLCFFWGKSCSSTDESDEESDVLFEHFCEL